MKKRNPIYTAGSFLLAGALTLSMAACSGAQAPAEATQTPSATATPAAAAAPAEETTPSAPESGALPVKALQPKQVEENPYMAKSDANIHHDGYNTDSTDEILPLGIYPEIHVSYETTNPNASPAIYFDNYGHAVVPLLGGIAIRDLNAEETKTLGYFSPKQHDGGSYLIQSSYTFLDAENRIVCPTSNNHVLINDSSIQSYANIYDQNWLMKGNAMIAPGVERVDTVKTDSGYEMKSIWTRNDLSDTAIMKLSTATGYIYGYVQDLNTGMWQYIILDFATGETVFTMDVSNKYGYNNMAIGMYTGNSGNALYCPTGYLELLRLQDRFVYLPELPYREVDLDQAARNVLAQDQFAQDGGEGAVASWRNTATIRNVHPNTTVAFRMNNLSGSASNLTLYAYGPDGKLVKVAPELWSITDETGAAATELTDGVLYELRVTVADGGDFDLSETEKEIKLSVVLGK